MQHMQSKPPNSPRRVPRPAHDKTATPLGERLDKAYKHARTTQTSVETKLVRAGLTSQGYLSRVRYGEGEDPSIRLIRAIASICGVDFTWLATGEGAMLPARTPPVPEPDPKTPSPPSAVRRAPTR
jgi:hypothetical protein